MPIVPIDTPGTQSHAAGSQNAQASPQPRSLPPARHRTRQQAPVNPPPAPAAARTSSSDYSVGYGRPPVHTRFKPGSSGNPRGRPKGARGLKTLAREVLTTRVPVRTASGEKKMHRIEAVLHKTVELAMKGNPRALAEILKLYASAVPETAGAETATPAEELTAGDLAILEALKTSILQEVGQ